MTAKENARSPAELLASMTHAELLEWADAQGIRLSAAAKKTKERTFNMLKVILGGRVQQ
jgi:hypothetical protein